jgi:hypothetical protein
LREPSADLDEAVGGGTGRVGEERKDRQAAKEVLLDYLHPPGTWVRATTIQSIADMDGIGTCSGAREDLGVTQKDANVRNTTPGKKKGGWEWRLPPDNLSASTDDSEAGTETSR